MTPTTRYPWQNKGGARYLKKLQILFVGLNFAYLGNMAWAQQSGDFANCSLANQQLKMLNDYMEPDLRIRASQSLVQDIELLRPHTVNNKTGLPDRLIKLCFDIKRNAFKTTFVKGGPSLFGSFEFLMAAGKYFFYEQEWADSFDAFEAAVKLRPNLYEPSYLALHALVYTQYTAEKPMPVTAYNRKVKDFVEKMLKSKDIKPDEKIVVLGFLAGAEEKVSKIYTARTMLQRSINLNPSDLKVRLQLGELEESAGQFRDAQKVYETALAAKLMDQPTEKKIYANLLRLYALLGETQKLAQTAQQALALYPTEPYFKNMAGQRAPATKQKSSP